MKTYELYNTNTGKVYYEGKMEDHTARAINRALRNQDSDSRFIEKREECPFTKPALNN